MYLHVIKVKDIDFAAIINALPMQLRPKYDDRVHVVKKICSLTAAWLPALQIASGLQMSFQTSALYRYLHIASKRVSTRRVVLFSGVLVAVLRGTLAVRVGIGGTGLGVGEGGLVLQAQWWGWVVVRCKVLDFWTWRHGHYIIW